MLWENTTNEIVLKPAREAIRQSWLETCELNNDHPQAKELFDPDKMPGLHDPFAGGGTIPLEAQRLGLEAFASDLNPVAVLINKAMIEIPPKFAGWERVREFFGVSAWPWVSAGFWPFRPRPRPRRHSPPQLTPMLQQRRQIFRRLWVRQINGHSAETFSKPLNRNRRMPRTP